jgi:hypothetical protein
MNTTIQNATRSNGFNLTQKLVSALTVCALFVIPVLSPGAAKAALVSLGTAGPGNFAVLEIGTGNLNISVNGGGAANGITGNVGLNGGGTLSLTSDTFVQGNVIVAQNVNQVTTSGSAFVSGSTTVNQALLTQARNDALAAAVQATFLGTQAGAINLGDVTGPLHLTTPGVYNINNLNLNQHDKLTLGGGSYVFNISGDFKISGDSLKAGVFLDAGMFASDVLFNYTGSAQIAFTGGGAGDNSQLYGIILSPNANVALSPGSVFGEIIGGMDIAIVSGSDVIGVVPEPTTFIAGALLLLPFGASTFRIMRKNRTVSA